jgi:hypothetical protein
VGTKLLQGSLRLDCRPVQQVLLLLINLGFGTRSSLEQVWARADDSVMATQKKPWKMSDDALMHRRELRSSIERM